MLQRPANAAFIPPFRFDLFLGEVLQTTKLFMSRLTRPDLRYYLVFVNFWLQQLVAVVATNNNKRVIFLYI
jgi:hypothetical protein